MAELKEIHIDINKIMKKLRMTMSFIYDINNLYNDDDLNDLKKKVDKFLLEIIKHVNNYFNDKYNENSLEFYYFMFLKFFIEKFDIKQYVLNQICKYFMEVMDLKMYYLLHPEIGLYGKSDLLNDYKTLYEKGIDKIACCFNKLNYVNFKDIKENDILYNSTNYEYYKVCLVKPGSIYYHLYSVEHELFSPEFKARMTKKKFNKKVFFKIETKYEKYFFP